MACSGSVSTACSMPTGCRSFRSSTPTGYGCSRWTCRPGSMPPPANWGSHPCRGNANSRRPEDRPASGAAADCRTAEGRTGIGLVPCVTTNELQLGQAEDFIGFHRPGRQVATRGRSATWASWPAALAFTAPLYSPRGASRAQPGLITLLTPEDVFVPVASQLKV